MGAQKVWPVEGEWSAFPNQGLNFPRVQIHHPALAEKGLVMGTVPEFPRVHLLLLLSIVLKRQTNPISYKEHKPGYREIKGVQ
jgi:hypothetical protein